MRPLGFATRWTRAPPLSTRCGWAMPGPTPRTVLSSCRRGEVDGLEHRRRAEEVEIDRLIGMPADLLGDEPNAETRSIGDREVAVHDAWAAFDDRLAPVGIPRREHLLDERVRRNGVNDERRC